MQRPPDLWPPKRNPGVFRRSCFLAYNAFLSPIAGGRRPMRTIFRKFQPLRNRSLEEQYLSSINITISIKLNWTPHSFPTDLESRSRFPFIHYDTISPAEEFCIIALPNWEEDWISSHPGAPDTKEELKFLYTEKCMATSLGFPAFYLIKKISTPKLRRKYVKDSFPILRGNGQAQVTFSGAGSKRYFRGIETQTLNPVGDVSQRIPSNAY